MDESIQSNSIKVNLLLEERDLQQKLALLMELGPFSIVTFENKTEILLVY